MFKIQEIWPTTCGFGDLYHQCQVTQQLLLEQLTYWGIDISSGQLNNLLLNAHDGFHNEKVDLLKKGLTITGYVTVDDTGTRHQEKTVM